MATHKIDLMPWEYEHANTVGIGRYTANWNVQNAGHYKQARMEDDRTAQVASAVCELAVAKYTNQYWHAHVWHNSEHNTYKHLPDVGLNIEVRRIRTRRSVAVRRHQVGKKLVLFAAEAIMPELRSVLIHGYIGYDVAWELGEPSDYSPETTRLYPLEKLITNGQ